jgi:hypothetical protein
LMEGCHKLGFAIPPSPRGLALFPQISVVAESKGVAERVVLLEDDWVIDSDKENDNNIQKSEGESLTVACFSTCTVSPEVSF